MLAKIVADEAASMLMDAVTEEMGQDTMGIQAIEKALVGPVTSEQAATAKFLKGLEKQLLKALQSQQTADSNTIEATATNIAESLRCEQYAHEYQITQILTALAVMPIGSTLADVDWEQYTAPKVPPAAVMVALDSRELLPLLMRIAVALETLAGLGLGIPVAAGPLRDVTAAPASEEAPPEAPEEMTPPPAPPSSKIGWPETPTWSKQEEQPIIAD